MPMMAPMLATLAEAPLVDPALVYEPKYDGIRTIVEVAAGGRMVRLWSRLGNEKTDQFPEIAAALAKWARRRTEPVVVDGEIVALDAKGEPAGFQQLQGRLQVQDPVADEDATALILFDVLRIGDLDLRDQPLTARRKALESLMGRTRSPRLRLSEQVRGDGRALYERALANGWEGLIAKHAASKYRSGKRSTDWRKQKILHEQEFVIAGWTAPNNSRTHFGALLLGVYEGDALVYAGNVGTGFDEQELARVMSKMTPLVVRDSALANPPKSSERPHWIRPELVAQIKFTEWTADHHLRHPVYLGLRDDKRARDVVREQSTRLHESTTKRLDAKTVTTPKSEARRGTRRTAPAASETHIGKYEVSRETTALIDQLRALEDARKDGAIELPGADTLAVTNLYKMFWPKLSITKGDLFRYYAQVAPVILPVLADRPLVMKRFPNGIDAAPFYQHRAPDVPAGVRVEKVAATDGRPQLVGGDLKTLLYTCQLAAISQDPWFSRVQSPGETDLVALDLDPADGVSFEQVLDVARWIRDELHTLGVQAWPKTSGASGLHIFIPLAPHTPFEAGLLFCQLVATLVSEKHPKAATVERAVRARGARVYVDCLQNIEGKTLASAYSVRASEYAGVSTPLTWKEVDRGVRREDFTIRTVPDRLATLGDLWAGIHSTPGVDLHRIAGS